MEFRVDLTLDCAHPTELAAFWKLALGYEDEPPPAPFKTREEWLEQFDLSDDDADDGAWLHDPNGVGPRVFFQQVPEAKVVKNRLHFDLGSVSLEHRDAQVESLTGLGARRVDIGQRDVPWIVLCDPEGNEFCVLQPRPSYDNSSRIDSIVVDCTEPVALAEFWNEAIGWPITSTDDSSDLVALRAPSNRGPFLEMLRVPDEKVAKNRLHIDLYVARDGTAEERWARIVQAVDRLTASGATETERFDGQHVVMADPEGNEFCVG